MKQRRLNEEADSEIYFPQMQIGFSELDVIVRTDGDPMALLPAIKVQIADLDPEQPVTKVRTWSHQTSPCCCSILSRSSSEIVTLGHRFVWG